MTPHKEDYLKVIMELGGDKQLVNNKQIGQALSVSAASVTEMSVKLLKDGLISHIPYQGVQITEKGQLIANKLIRKHRLWKYSSRKNWILIGTKCTKRPNCLSMYPQIDSSTDWMLI